MVNLHYTVHSLYPLSHSLSTTTTAWLTYITHFSSPSLSSVCLSNNHHHYRYIPTLHSILSLSSVCLYNNHHHYRHIPTLHSILSLSSVCLYNNHHHYRYTYITQYTVSNLCLSLYQPPSLHGIPYKVHCLYPLSL
jgi:hypothetical protein